MTTMKPFAFYGRVSTEDQQDPESSKGWQLSRATALIEPHGGRIVAEYFDIGQSRSLPWKRRPQAARLLDDLRRADRPFSAVVIGEPARAFYGQQFGLTFPVLTHYGVELWVPEVGGAVDPGSDAHDLVMSLYGGMSKGERNRIKVRVRSAMASQAATEGRFLGGRPPYGYLLGDAGPHPNPAKAANGQRLRQLEIDPLAAPVVQRIFAEYLEGRGLMAIAEGLTAEGIPSPSGHDPARNRHRQATRGAWSKSAIRAILRNPRYTGRQVWNRQRRDEVLLDVDDIAAGHETKMRWNPEADWIWSPDLTHEPIIDTDTFDAAQQVASAGAHRARTAVKRPTDRPYLLRSLVFCGTCGRRMEGTWNHGRAHYRCQYPREYAQTKGLDHPPTVYLREDEIVPALDEWLAQVFDENNLDATCAALAEASEADPAADARTETARRQLADCDDRLAKYRAALEAGANPATVAGWMREVEGERQRAAAQLADAPPPAELNEAQVRALVTGLRDILDTLARADPATKAKLYNELGLKLTYEPDDRQVLVEARPATRVAGCVSEGGLQTQPQR